MDTACMVHVWFGKTICPKMFKYSGYGVQGCSKISSGGVHHLTFPKKVMGHYLIKPPKSGGGMCPQAPLMPTPHINLGATSRWMLSTWCYYIFDLGDWSWNSLQYIYFTQFCFVRLGKGVTCIIDHSVNISILSMSKTSCNQISCT